VDITSIERQILTTQADIQILKEQHEELSLAILKSPSDEEIHRALDQTEKDISVYQRKLARIRGALDAANRENTQEVRAAKRQARVDAANEAIQLAEERNNLARKMDQSWRKVADQLKSYHELNNKIHERAHHAGLRSTVLGRQADFTGMDYAIGAILENCGVREMLTLSHVGVGFKQETCEETTTRSAEQLRAHLENVRYPGDE